MSEAEQLALARDRLQALGSAAWTLTHGEGGTFLDARLRTGKLLRIADFDPAATDAEKEFILHAPSTLRLMSDLVARAAAKVRDLTREVERLRDEVSAVKSGEGKNYAAEAAIKCGEPTFRRFLADRYGLTRDNEDAAAACLRLALAIDSRKLLNTDSDAAARWREMRRDFEAWGRGQA